MAKRSKDQARISNRKPQLITGLVGTSDGLYAKIDRKIADSDRVESWKHLAQLMGMTRQAVISSVRRAKVPISRLHAISTVLDIDVLDLVDDELTLQDNAKLV